MGDAVGKKKTEGQRCLRIDCFHQTAVLLFVKFEDVCCKKHRNINLLGTSSRNLLKKKKEASTTQGPFIRMNVEVTLPAAS